MKRKFERKHNILERITFGCGVVIVTALIGFLVYQMLQNEEQQAQLEIAIERDRRVNPNGYIVSVYNAGDETAEATVVKFELFENAKSVAEADIQFNFVPPKSKKTGWINFYTPRSVTDSVAIVSVSYLQP